MRKSKQHRFQFREKRGGSSGGSSGGGGGGRSSGGGGNASTKSAEDRVFEAATINGEYNKRVYISDVRDRLPEMSREEFNASLDKLELSERIVLYPLDRSELTPAREAGAIYVGGSPRHILYVRRPT